ncbi:hypothetical protein mRhiFer1_008498 [Rhinolophus ferrumequinum]|uniref:Uncharacterized protein n=1 Tax=Rhinolophus ferrumequinum TaxID=59479 RepID=A0A7J7UX62_RHIFE|nr:hypothetical protein mRhiFer1_008498 [Rhinolophus ferrumequinum]
MNKEIAKSHDLKRKILEFKLTHFTDEESQALLLKAKEKKGPRPGGVLPPWGRAASVHWTKHVKVQFNPRLLNIRRENLDLQNNVRDVRTQKTDRVREAGFCKPGKEASEETKPADTLILDFQPPEL